MISATTPFFISNLLNINQLKSQFIKNNTAQHNTSQNVTTTAQHSKHSTK